MVPRDRRKTEVATPTPVGAHRFQNEFGPRPIRLPRLSPPQHVREPEGPEFPIAVRDRLCPSGRLRTTSSLCPIGHRAGTERRRRAGTTGRIRTDTWRVLSALPLPLGYRGVCRDGRVRCRHRSSWPYHSAIRPRRRRWRGSEEPVGESGFEPEWRAPKARALPGCATPRKSVASAGQYQGLNLIDPDGAPTPSRPTWLTLAGATTSVTTDGRPSRDRTDLVSPCERDAVPRRPPARV